MSDPLVLICSIHCYSQTIRARELKFWENAHPTPCVMGHMSRVTCHVSLVTCHMSYVILLFYILIFFFLSKNFLQSGRASRWRVCYQWYPPRIVYNNSSEINSDSSDSSDYIGRFQQLWQYKKFTKLQFSQKKKTFHYSPKGLHIMLSFAQIPMQTILVHDFLNFFACR